MAESFDVVGPVTDANKREAHAIREELEKSGAMRKVTPLDDVSEDEVGPSATLVWRIMDALPAEIEHFLQGPINVEAYEDWDDGDRGLCYSVGEEKRLVFVAPLLYPHPRSDELGAPIPATYDIPTEGSLIPVPSLNIIMHYADTLQTEQKLEDLGEYEWKLVYRPPTGTEPEQITLYGSDGDEYMGSTYAFKIHDEGLVNLLRLMAERIRARITPELLQDINEDREKVLATLAYISKHGNWFSDLF